MVSDRYGTNQVSCARETRLRACFVILDWNSEIDPSLNARWELDSENDDWSTHVPQTFVVPSESQSFSLCVLIHRSCHCTSAIPSFLMFSMDSIRYPSPKLTEWKIVMYGTLGGFGWVRRILVFKHPGRYSRALTLQFNYFSVEITVEIVTVIFWKKVRVFLAAHDWHTRNEMPFYRV